MSPAPTGAVSNIRLITASSRSAVLIWDDVPCTQRGGLLLWYAVNISSRNTLATTKQVKTNATSVAIDGLSPFTNYTASIQYVNGAGSGPSVDYSFNTLEDGRFVSFFFFSSFCLS